MVSYDKVCLPHFRTNAVMSEQHLGGSKLIHYLLCFAGGSVHDIMDLKLCSCSCAHLDYSTDMLKTHTHTQVRTNWCSQSGAGFLLVYYLNSCWFQMVGLTFEGKFCLHNKLFQDQTWIEVKVSLQFQACKSAKQKMKYMNRYCVQKVLCAIKLMNLQQSLGIEMEVHLYLG